MDEDIKKYERILDMDHHSSQTRPRMSVGDRAAQFSPFAALSGFADEIEAAKQMAIDEVEHEIERTAFVEDA